LASSVSSLDTDRIEDSATEVREDIDELERSAQDVDGPPVAELKTDFNQLTEAIQQFGQGGGDLRSNLQAVQAPLSEFSTTLSSFVQAYSCE
jgi:prefoldin subunit 5